MLDPNKQSIAAQIFADYRSENNHLLTKFKNIKTFLNRLKKLDDIERHEIVGGMFSLNSDLGPAFDSIDLNLSRLIEIVEELIKCLEKEKKDLDNYMSKLKQATIESEKRLESLLINYNNEQYDYMQQLNTLIPGLIELADRAIGMEDQTMEKTANSIAGAFRILLDALKNEDTNKDDLYIALEGILLKLSKHAKFLHEILGHLGEKKDPGKFVVAFRSMPSLMRKFEKHRVNCGRDKSETKDNLFTDIEGDDNGEKKEKLDNFMKGTLESLFAKININSKPAKKAIGEIIVIDRSLKELNKAFKKLFKKLQDVISNKKCPLGYSELGGGLESLELPDHRGKLFALKALSFDIKDEKEMKKSITFILRTLENALEGKEPWKDNRTFKEMILNNSDIFTNTSKLESGSESSGEWYSDGIKLKESELIECIDDTIAQAQSVLSGSGLVDGWEGGLPDLKSEILTALKSIAKTLNENDGIQISSNQAYMNNLKNNYDIWKKDIQETSLVAFITQLVNDLNNLKNELK